MFSDRGLAIVRKIAKKKRITGEINISNIKNKRFNIIVNGKIIHFGLYPFAGKGTYIDHKDKKIKKAWQARHEKILKNGKPAYLDKTSPEYYSYHLLW